MTVFRYHYMNVSATICNMSLIYKSSISQYIVTRFREKIAYYINFIYSFFYGKCINFNRCYSLQNMPSSSRY